jgi:glycerol kinase
MTITPEPVWCDGLSTTIAWASAEVTKFALEGNIFTTGGAVQWLGEFLNLPDPVRDAARLAMSVPDNGGVYLVPAFTGLGAPHWDAAARGVLSGLTRGSTAAHAARAALEAIAFQVRDVFEAMRHAAGNPIAALLADGGGTRNDFLMQFQADILDRVVLRSADPDVSARGAAWLAGLAAGIWKSLPELAALPRAEQRFEPAMKPSERARLYDGWREAVRRATNLETNLETQSAPFVKL